MIFGKRDGENSPAPWPVPAPSETHVPACETRSTESQWQDAANPEMEELLRIHDSHPGAHPCCVGPYLLHPSPFAWLIRSALLKPQLLLSLAILILLQVSWKPNQAKSNKSNHHHKQVIQLLLLLIFAAGERAHISLPEESASQGVTSKQRGVHHSCTE